MERDRITKGIGRFVEDHFLEIDFVDTLFIATVLGVFYIFKDYVDAKKVRMKNNILRVRDNRGIAPLNPRIKKEVGQIVEASS